jgi:hypothetical protein
MNRTWSSPRQDQLCHTSGNTRTWVVKSLGTLGCRARGVAGQHTVQAISSNSKRLKQDEMKQESRLKEYTYIHTYIHTLQQQHCNSSNTATATQQRQQQQHGNSNNTATATLQQQHSNNTATATLQQQHTMCYNTPPAHRSTSSAMHCFLSGYPLARLLPQFT